MIQLVIDRLKHCLHVAEVHDPARLHPRLAGQMQFDAERMPVQSRAFVAFRHIGKPVRGLQGEDLEDIHRRIVQRAPKATHRRIAMTPPAASTFFNAANPRLPRVPNLSPRSVASRRRTPSLLQGMPINHRDHDKDVWWYGWTRIKATNPLSSKVLGREAATPTVKVTVRLCELPFQLTRAV